MQEGTVLYMDGSMDGGLGYIWMAQYKKGCVIYGWSVQEGIVLYMDGSMDEGLGYIWMAQYKRVCV